MSTPSVLISDPRGFNTQRVPVNGADRSWVVNGSGTASVEVLSETLIDYNLNGELRGSWLVIEDDDAGTWGGKIGDVQPNGDSTTEIAASDWKSMFEKVRIPRRNRPLYGMPGTLSLEAITMAFRQHGTPIQVRSADDIGLPVALPLDGGDLRQAIDSMADESGQEWWIDDDTMAYQWGIKGLDLTGSVQFIEGKHISDWRLPQSIDPVVNDLEAFPINDRYQAMQTLIVENAASIAAVGRRQGSMGIPGGSHAVHIRSRAIGAVNGLASLGNAIEFDLLNIDGAFASFRHGDTVCVLLTSISVQVTCRIMGRSLGDNRVMGCSGIVVDRRALA